MSTIRCERERSGGPLRALAGLFLCWIAARSLLFEMPFERPQLLEGAPAIASMAQGLPEPLPYPQPARAAAAPAAGGSPASLSPLPPTPLPPTYRLDSFAVSPPLSAPPARDPNAARQAAGHNLLWMAAMQGIPLLPAVQAALGEPGGGKASAPPSAAVPPRSSGRWSGDGWLVWRSGGRGIAASGAMTPLYGGSQAGALLRYELAPGSAQRPAAYLRGTAALDSPREGDLAAGLALRPLAGIPVTAHAEARLSRRGPDVTVRPAAFLSSGVDAVPVAHGVTVRGYGQAGYVGGRDATGFADGSLVAEKPLRMGRDSLLAAGAGAWGGVQRGAGRLDLGPSASLRFRLGEGSARVSADYRLRVAGSAEPARGVAVTLAAGF